jgi:tryptophan-rich sensory protein
VLLAAAAVLAVAALGPWRRHPLGPPAAVLVITLGTLVGDVLTGSTLELNGLLGYDPIVAGRFTGFGNLGFGLLGVSALLLTAALAAAAGRRAPAGRARVATAAVVLGAGALTVLVVGAPVLGRDFGGVLAALPGFLLLAMLLTGTRVTVTRLAAVLALAVAAVGSLAFVDWLRPPSERSHLGRFVEQLLTGEAWTVVSRKAEANLGILFGSPLAWLLPVALVAAVWLVRPAGWLPGPLRGPGLLRGRGDLLPAGDLAVLRAGLLAAALSLALGAAANDSGVALPATAAALLVPLLVWLGAGPRSGAEVSDGTPSDRAGEGGTRVTVVSRGSTAWHA